MSEKGSWIRFGEREQYAGYWIEPQRTDEAVTTGPAVLLIQEIWGVEAHIRDVAGRLAASGFAVLAPDLYFKEGGKPPELQEERIEDAKRFLDTLPPGAWHDSAVREAKLVELPERQRLEITETLRSVFSAPGKMTDYVETVMEGARYLRSRGGSAARSGKVAAVGFCLGGALAAQLAVHDSELDAAVVFYGSLPAEDQAARISCPVLGHFGELDERITGQVPAFAAAMERYGKRFDYRIYENAPHAFFNDTRASYRKEAAHEAWERTLAFLRERLS